MNRILARALLLLLLLPAPGCSDAGADLPANMPDAPCRCNEEMDPNSAACKVMYKHPQICPDLSPVRFCGRDVGNRVVTDVIISNRGLAGLRIDSVQLLGDENCAFDPPQFSLKAGGVIPYRGREAVQLVYRPQKVAADQVVLRIESNAENFRQLNIAVCGQGLMAGTPENPDGGMCLSCMSTDSKKPACGHAPDGGT